MSTSTLQVTPVRVSTDDDPYALLHFAADAFRSVPVALATLVDIRGGAARGLGSHIVVAADGRFCGYVSGGCVETAVASEALLALAEGRDRLVKYGEGSPFFDIVLPCGGGITVAIHVLRARDAIVDVLRRLDRRETAALIYTVSEERLDTARLPGSRTTSDGDVVQTVYRPVTRLVISGQVAESERLHRLAEAAGYDVYRCGLNARPAELASEIDPMTAVVLLHHDLDAEVSVLETALHSNAFYIGALGSSRTHQRRLKALRNRGFADGLLERIRAPIGMFGPTRDTTSLALSILVDVAAKRLEIFG